MKQLSWDEINEMSDAEINYLLYIEGKNIGCISHIRGQDRSKVERDIIECRVRYRAFEGTKNIEDLVKKIMKYSRDERKLCMNQLTEEDKKSLENYAINGLFDSGRDECLFYIWILGELKSQTSVPKLITFLKCTDGNIKRMCCSALGKIGDPQSEEILIGCTFDKRPQVRQYAIKALAGINSIKSDVRLKEIVNDIQEKEYVKRAAMETLNRMMGGNSGE